MWVGHGRAPKGHALGDRVGDLVTEQGDLFWVPDSSFLRRSSTFRGVWRVKRPLNPTKQGPLRPYRGDLRNGSRIMFIRVRCFEKSRSKQQTSELKSHSNRLSDPLLAQQSSSTI